jgi:dTDP-4-amino-4,6-dideoxygalactose transaminase
MSPLSNPKSPHAVTLQLEHVLAEYCGSRHAVVVNSCTNALLLCLMWQRWVNGQLDIEIPRRTYVGVAHAVLNAGHRLHFRDEEWVGGYELKICRDAIGAGGLDPVWDYARRFTSGMYRRGEMHCVSFHVSKICGATQGGAVLLDRLDAAQFMRRARFDGRSPNVHPSEDYFGEPAIHCYISPTDAAQILWKLSTLPEQNDDLPTDNYPDLSTHRFFISPLRAMSRARRQAAASTLPSS